MTEKTEKSEATPSAWTDHEEWAARREREKGRIRVKLAHLVGLIDVLAHEHDQIRRGAARERLVEAFWDLTTEGPGPDPVDEARRKAEWEGRLPAGPGT